MSVLKKILGWLSLSLIFLWSGLSFIWLMLAAGKIGAHPLGLATFLFPQLIGIAVALFYYDRFWSQGISHFCWTGVVAFFNVWTIAYGFLPLPVTLYLCIKSLSESRVHSYDWQRDLNVLILAMVMFVVFWLLLYAANRLLLPKKPALAS